MASQGVYTVETFEAGQDLSAKQYHFVTMASDGQVDPTGAGAAADGVLQNAPAAAGRAAAVAVVGRVKVLCGGTISANANVASNASGQAVAATTGNIVLGKALEAGAANQYITIDFFKGGNASA